MKKAMKLVWMVLFALPMVAFTACGDDDEPDNGLKFKDYSVLLDKTRKDIVDKEMKDYTPYETPAGALFYDNDGNALGQYIDEVDCYFTWDDPFNVAVPEEKCVWVDTEMSGVNAADLMNYLTDKYGKAAAENDDMDSYTFTKGNMYVWYDIDAEEGVCYVGYVNKKSYDDYNNGNAQNIRKALKARRAAKRAAR